MEVEAAVSTAWRPGQAVSGGSSRDTVSPFFQGLSLGWSESLVGE